jgi:magnesium transporter
MIYTYKHKDITWVDLENPTKSEVRDLIEQFNIEPVVAEELLTPTTRSRSEPHPDYIYLILHFPQQIENHNYEQQLEKKNIEVDFIIGKNFIITARYGAVDAIMEFSKIFEADSILDRRNIGKHAGYIFYYMIRNIYKSMYLEIQNMRDKIEDFEDQVFSGNEREMVAALSKMNRVLLYYKESLLFHKEILLTFEDAGKQIFEPEFTYYLRAVLGEYYKVQNSLESSKEYLEELRETNDSLLSSKQNEIMKILTVTNFVFLPLALIAGIFGMNTIANPIVGTPNDFFVVLAMMLVLAGGMYIFFRNKKWL